jgi:hypothetical protein
MEDLLETPEDYGCYIVDRRGQGVEESVNELVSLRSFFLPFVIPPTCPFLASSSPHHPYPRPSASYRPAPCADFRPTNSSPLPTSPDDNVSTSETELNDYPNS